MHLIFKYRSAPLKNVHNSDVTHSFPLLKTLFLHCKMAVIRSYEIEIMCLLLYFFRCIEIILELILVWIGEKSISVILLPACCYFHIWLQFFWLKIIGQHFWGFPACFYYTVRGHFLYFLISDHSLVSIILQHKHVVHWVHSYSCLDPPQTNRCPNYKIKLTWCTYCHWHCHAVEHNVNNV